MPEFVDNFFTSVGEKWEDFLDWSDEKGLPLRRVSDFLESHGIPPLPFFVIVILALVIGAFILMVSLTAMQLGVFTVTVQSPSSQIVTGAMASISYFSVNGTLITLSGLTDSNGVASFSDVPLGVNVSVSVSNSNYQPGNAQTSFSSNGTGVTISLVPVATSTVSLPVLVQGPAQATIILLVNGTQFDSEVASPAYTFNLQPGVNYSITASAPGWRGYQSYVEIAQDSSNFIIRMFQFGQAITGSVSAVVKQDVPPNSAITNANVNIIESSTNKILGTLSTNGSVDGSTNSIQVVAGDSVYLSASAPGYLSRTSSVYNISENGINPIIYLDALNTQNSQNVGVNVVDVNGNNVQSPLVSVYCNGVLFAQDTPANGVDSFNVPIGTTCLVTAFLQGYLPSSKLVTSAGVGTIIMQTVNSFNSGGLSVETMQGGNPVAGVSVSFLNSINQPLGIPSQNTGPDGFTTFQGVPLGNVTIQASGQGLAGNSSVFITNSSNFTTVVVQLTSAPTPVNITAFDFVTGNPISVFNASSSGVFCATTIGSCVLNLPSGIDVITITSPNYQTLSSSITLSAGVQSNQSFVLIPSSFSQSLQLEFLGVYNNGFKVNSLSPNTNYEARFILNAPTLNFSTASVYVQLGGSEDISTDPAFISSFSGNPSSGSSLNSNTTSNELKWVLYNVTSFNGSQEFDVFIQTNSVSNASLNLQWSDSYTFGNSTFSSPSSGLNSQLILISFEGDCANGICVQLFFSGVLGSGLSGFQALTPEIFKLNYNILSNTSTPLLIQTNSSGLQLIQAVENSQTIQAQDNTLSFNSNGSGYVLIKALSPINNGGITFNAGSYSKQLYVRVIASNYNINVNYAPTNIKALDETKLNFTVTDSNGVPVTDATIQLTGILDNPVQAVYSNGFYTADITPNAPGILYFTVSSPGYRVYSGSINVGVDKIISVTPSTLSLSVNSLNFSTVDFQVQNLLNQNTLLTFQTVTFSPRYTVVSTTVSSATVQGLASFTNSLQAAVSNAIQMAALQTNTLSENVKGYVNVIARTGGYTQTIQIPFNIQTSYTQTNMRQAVSLSASALQFQVILPMQPSSTQNEIITNNAPFPVLVNAQTSSGEFQVTPLSAAIPAGGSQTFAITAYLPWIYQQLQCVVSQAPDTGIASFYASAEGVSSQALPVTLSSSIQSYGTCQIPGGLVVKLPFSTVFMFANGSAAIGQQSQQDGSVPVLIPQGLMIFQYGSGVQQSFVSVPAGVGVEVQPGWVSSSSTETDITFPVPIMISTGSAKVTVNGDGSTSLTTDSGTLILPSGSQSEANQQLNYNSFLGSSYTPFMQTSAISTQITNPYAYSYNPGLINPYGFGPTVQPFSYVQNGYLVPAGGTIKFTSSSVLLHSLTFDYSAYGKVLVGGVSENQGSVVPTNGGFDITFPKCSQIKVYNTQINPGLKLSDTLPVAKEVILQNAAQTSSGFEVQGQIQIKACTDVADETQKYFTTVLPTPLFFNLPSITRTSAGNYDLGGCDTLNITGGSLPIMQASKIIFQSGYQESKDNNGNWMVSVDRLGVVSVLPCGVGGVIKVTPPDNNVYVTFNNKAVNQINRINFTLTSSQRSQTQEIVFNNYANTVLNPAGQVDSEGRTTYIQSIDLNMSNFFTIDSLQFHSAPQMPPLGKSNFQNTLELTAVAALAGACLPDQTLTGTITIALQGNNEIIKTLYVTVTTKSEGCASNNLGNALTNFSIFPDNVYFKNPGSHYFTFVSFVNNLRQPVKIEMKPNDAITCVFNSYSPTALSLSESQNNLDSGFAITANCTGLKPTINNPVFFNAVDPTTGKILATANFTATVFAIPQNEQSFYTSTPIGSLAPLGVPASFITCENQFCNYNQTAQAFQDFFNNTTNFLNESFPNSQTVINYCSNVLYNQKGRPWTTSALFLMANTNENIGDVLNSLGSDLTLYGFNSQSYNTLKGSTLTGCGLFEVTAKYNLCLNQGPDWKQKAGVEVDVQKLQSCPQTVADSPLLFMGNPPSMASAFQSAVQTNETQLWVGDQLSNSYNFNVQTSKPIFFLGHYVDNPNGNAWDANVMSTLLKSFYSPVQLPYSNSGMASYYDDGNYCISTAVGLETGILGAQVAITGGISLLSLVFPALIPVLPNVWRGFLTGAVVNLPGCLASITASAVSKGSTACNGANGCVDSAVAGAVSQIVSTIIPSCSIGTLAIPKAIKIIGAASAIGVAGGVVAGGIGGSGFVGPVTSASVSLYATRNYLASLKAENPLLITSAPSAISASASPAAASAASLSVASKEGVLTQLRNAEKSLSNINTQSAQSLNAEINSQIKLIEEGGTVDAAAIADLATKSSSLGDEVSRTLNIDQISLYIDQISLADAATTSLQTAAVTASASDIATTSVATVSTLQIETTISQKAKNLFSFAKQNVLAAALCAAGPAAAAYLATPNVRPVQVMLNIGEINDIIVYHLSYSLIHNTPSIYRLCYNSQQGSSECTPLYLANFCNSNYSLCLSEIALNNMQNVLIVSVNNDNLDQTYLSNLFQSIFTPSVSPVVISNPSLYNATVFNGFNDFGSLNYSYDNGNQQGFGTAAPPSTQTVTLK